MQTELVKKADADRRWYVISAEGQVLGRFAAKLSRILQGKNKPSYTPNIDTGDFVVVTDAEKIVLTGNKLATKVYPYYTGYPSGQKFRKAADLIKTRPGDILRNAVRRMLPKSRLGRAMLMKLKTYRGPEHPHAAQRPAPLDLSRV